MKYAAIISEMKAAILNHLSTLENGYGHRKWKIEKETGIPINVLTVLLKELKNQKKIELMVVFSEESGLADGSAYCLTGKSQWT